MNLIKYGNFRSAAGLDLTWKIECDALSDDDFGNIAKIAAPVLHPFSAVSGVPDGGGRLACAFGDFLTETGPLLVVDDVWTTGKSMRDLAGTILGWKGFVIFARGETPPNITSFFRTQF